MWIMIAILCVIMMFLIVLALYRLYSIDIIHKECNKKIDEIKEKYWKVEKEKEELNTFKLLVENLVTGMRSDKEVRDKIKELLSQQR